MDEIIRCPVCGENHWVDGKPISWMWTNKGKQIEEKVIYKVCRNCGSAEPDVYNKIFNERNIQNINP